MESLKNVFARWNWAASVPDSQHDIAAVATRADPNSSAGTIVFSRVLQKVLHNERRVAFLARNKKPARKFLFNLHIGRIRQRAKIIQPFINELTKIHWCRCDLKVTGIHA